MISAQEQEAFVKKDQPADFFIMRNDSASTHFTEEQQDAMKQNSLMSMGSMAMGSINPHDKMAMRGAARWTVEQQAALGDESFSDDE